MIAVDEFVRGQVYLLSELRRTQFAHEEGDPTVATEGGVQRQLKIGFGGVAGGCHRGERVPVGYHHNVHIGVWAVDAAGSGTEQDYGVRRYDVLRRLGECQGGGVSEKFAR